MKADPDSATTREYQLRRDARPRSLGAGRAERNCWRAMAMPRCVPEPQKRSVTQRTSPGGKRWNAPSTIRVMR